MGKAELEEFMHNIIIRKLRNSESLAMSLCIKEYFPNGIDFDTISKIIIALSDTPTLLRDFLKVCPDLNMVDDTGYVFLNRFSYHANRDTIWKEMLGVGVDINHCNYLGQTIIFYELDYGAVSTDKLESYIKLGANVNIQDRVGNTLLHYLALLKAVENMSWLHEHGASLNLRNIYGQTPSDLLAQDFWARIRSRRRIRKGCKKYGALPRYLLDTLNPLDIRAII